MTGFRSSDAVISSHRSYIVLHVESSSTQLLLVQKQTMAPKDKESMAGGPTFGSPATKNQNTTSANAQSQTLLEALQDLIVRVMVPKQTNETDQMHSGPEAGKLITALQEFISGIVLRSQSGVQNTIIDVSLDEGDSEPPETNLDDDEEDGESSSELDGNAIGNINSSDSVALDLPQPTFEENLLWTLRERVFNKMPIRLLCFEPHGSSFRIGLLERGAIFARLASEIQGKLHEEEFSPQSLVLRGIDGQDEIQLEKDGQVIERVISKYAGYAILSHTWLRTTPGEVTYGDWNKGFFNSEDPGYRKLVNFCKAAWKDHQLTFGWMDTVCINKESSSELDESIRSMYNWYKRAAMCVTYLAETEILADMHLDPWFTRGWTLQELLAPRFIKFYNGHWQHLVDRFVNDKADREIIEQIKCATTISELELKNIHKAPISRRMQLAATREVTREEDTAYSLMGIFNVSISTAYGEGSGRAFHRLLQEIMASSKKSLDILNWAGDIPFSYRDNISAILPFSPRCYIKRSSNRKLTLPQPMEPLTLSPLGLHVPVILMPAISIRNTELERNSIGDYTAIVDISPVLLRYGIKVPTTYNLLDNRISGSDGWNDNGPWRQMTFAVFNFGKNRNYISLPKTCIALGLDCSEPANEVSNTGHFGIIRTDEPIVFELSRSNADSPDTGYWFWSIQVDELAKHGMQLTSLNL